MTNAHIINENPCGSVTVCPTSLNFLITYKHHKWSLPAKNMLRFKESLKAKAEPFIWFNTLLYKTALIVIPELDIEMVLTKNEIKGLAQLLIETELIIESRLAALPKTKNTND